MPFAATGDEILVRAPSVMCPVATLGLLAWWMRPRGMLGAFRVIAASLMPFMVMHGREARMYAVVMFLGLAAAIGAERWLARPSQRAAAIVSVAGVPGVGAALGGDRRPGRHVAAAPGTASGSGCLVVPRLAHRGVRRVGRHLGSVVPEQAEVVSGFWIPLTSVSWLQTAGAALITERRPLVPVSFLVLILAVVTLLLRSDAISKVAALTLVAPFVLVAIAGRAAPPPAEVLRVRGVGVAAALGGSEELAEIDRRIEPRDQISIQPAWFRPLLEWRFVVS